MTTGINSIFERRAKERFDREKACYEQNCQQFRSLNQLMWQIPIIAMTLTGGLWFGVSKLDNPESVGVPLLAFAAAGNAGLIVVLVRIRFVIGEYLCSIREFYTPGYVSANGSHWFDRSHVVIGVFSILLGLAAGLSVLGAMLVWSGAIMQTNTVAESTSHIRCVVDTYDRDADRYLSQYESVTFEQVHADIVDLLPHHPIRVLDIGAGSGRDAAALAQKGLVVTAVEPSAQFRAAARRLHPDPNIRWIDDCLPELSSVKAYGLKFDMLFLSAVWMNIQPADRYASFETVAEVLNPKGTVVITLRHGQTDPERYIHEVSVAEIEILSKQFALRIIRNVASPDALGRDLSWTTLVLQRE